MTTIRLYLHMIMSMLLIMSYSAVYSPSMQIDPMPKSPTITYEEIDISYARSLPIHVEESIIETVTGSRYGFTEEDIYLLAQLLCGDESIDGDGEYDFVWNLQNDKPYLEEMGKVLNVVMNRQRSGQYSTVVRDIVLQKSQFSPMPENLNTTPSDLAIEAVREWCRAYDAYTDVQIIPEDHLYFTAGPGLTNVTRRDW